MSGNYNRGSRQSDKKHGLHACDLPFLQHHRRELPDYNAMHISP